MRLWSDEIEAMRPEAREVVAAGIEVVPVALAGEASRPRACTTAPGSAVSRSPVSSPPLPAMASIARSPGCRAASSSRAMPPRCTCTSTAAA